MADESPPSSLPPSSLPPASVPSRALSSGSVQVAPPASVPPASVPPASLPPASLPPGATGPSSLRMAALTSGAIPTVSTVELKLGRILAESKPPPRALAVFIVGIAGLALWLGLSIGLPLTSGREAAVSVIIISFLLLPPSALAARWGHARGALYVAVHENGLERRDTTGTVKLAWGDIAGIFEHASEHRGEFGKELRGSFTFVGKHQRIVIDSELREWIELGRAARERAEAELFDAYERATDEKRSLPFGAIVLHPTSVQTPDGNFPWKEITFLRLERKGFDAWWNVQRGGYACVSKVPTHEVANNRLLVGVLAKNGKLDGIEIAVRAELEAMIDDTKQD